ncbi:hypothetical protein [Pleomorphovibrio marinus]|uniref:hypothetical protein n=1 Tax=Pleomorphovibrio marinus TaxID=2164132 RepID=UPI0013005E4C|nr:hypothetical protein [Pleomorphovibrio marinus]
MKDYFTDIGLNLIKLNKFSIKYFEFIMEELSIEKIEIVSGGALPFCASNGLGFMAGATTAGTIFGGGIGFVAGLAVGTLGGYIINQYGKPC